MYRIGIDLGGTNIAAGLVDEKMSLVRKKSVPTGAERPGEEIVADMAKVCLALCEEHGLPILMHTGDYRYQFSNPDRLIPVLKAFPRLNVIGAHFGGWSVWDDASRLLADFPNLFVDCSSTFPFANNDLALGERLIARYGAERVMFGSDFPMWSPEVELNTFMQLRLTDEERRLILSENAKKIYHIDQ